MNTERLLPRRRRRVALTGLARAGKTALLTSLAANLLAFGAGRAVLPALARRLGGREMSVRLAAANADELPRFDALGHLAALIADPPRWPQRTEAVGLLALDLDIPRHGLGGALPARRIRLELLDYPGEWLVDLPMLGQDFAQWSEAALRRLEKPELAEIVRPFLAFSQALPAEAAADEALAEQGHRLYRGALRRLRDESGLSLLQPGRFLMPPPGPEPPWMLFFPARGAGGLARLLARRFDAYRGAAGHALLAPGFGVADSLVVAADVLGALSAGPVAFADASAALGAAVGALRLRRRWSAWLAAAGRLRRPPPQIKRAAFVATKADHVAQGQRGSLERLLGALTALPHGAPALPTYTGVVAAVRCTEDFIWTLDGHPVSAVRGRGLDGQALRSWPGEVPDHMPDAEYWAHRFLRLPEFEPMRPGQGGAVPQLGLDELLVFLLEDIL